MEEGGAMPRRAKLRQKKDTTTTWRVLAIICGLCWAVVLAADVFPYPAGLQAHPMDVIPRWGFPALYILSILACLVLVVYPKKFIIYTIMCCLWGVVVLVEGGGTNGILFYLLGMGFGYVAGIFKKHPLPKLAIFLAICLTSIISQFRYGAGFVSGVLLSFIFLLLVYLLVWFLMQEAGGLAQLERDIFATFSPAKRKTETEIASEDEEPPSPQDIFQLTEEQQKIISCIHQGMVYKEIAVIIGKSESHVKRQVKTIRSATNFS